MPITVDLLKATSNKTNVSIWSYFVEIIELIHPADA